MGRRIRMPLCRCCGRRIQYRYNTWRRFETALERATLLAVHREASPIVRYDETWDEVTERYTKLEKGYVKVLEGRGWNGQNVFCGSYCAVRWLKANPPEVQWEPWPRTK